MSFSSGKASFYAFSARDFFSVVGLLHFYINFRIALSNSMKNILNWDFDRDDLESMDECREN